MVIMWTCSGVNPGLPTIEHTLYGTGGVVAIALLNNELFVCRLQENSLVVYDATSLEFKRQLSIPGYGMSEGLAVCPVNNCLYISDKQHLCVHRIDLSTNTITSWNLPDSPYGISVKSSNQNVLVVLYPSKKVREFTPDHLYEKYPTAIMCLTSLNSTTETCWSVEMGPRWVL